MIVCAQFVSCDPYAVVTLNGKKIYQTEFTKKTRKPIWKRDIPLYGLRMSPDSNTITIELYDWYVEKTNLLHTNLYLLLKLPSDL